MISNLSFQGKLLRGSIPVKNISVKEVYTRGVDEHKKNTAFTQPFDILTSKNGENKRYIAHTAFDPKDNTVLAMDINTLKPINLKPEQLKKPY